jgi:hypothetical protein
LIGLEWAGATKDCLTTSSEAAHRVIAAVYDQIKKLAIAWPLQFTRRVGVTYGSVNNWENRNGPLFRHAI